MPVGVRLVVQAEEAERNEHFAAGKDLYLRARAIYRIGRFLINRSKLPQQAWEGEKAAYLKDGRYLDPPNQGVVIPFNHTSKDAGDEAKDIPAYLRIPTSSKAKHAWPVLLLICGIWAYWTDYTNRTDA